MSLHLFCSYSVDVQEWFMRNNDIFKYCVVPASLFLLKLFPKRKSLQLQTPPFFAGTSCPMLNHKKRLTPLPTSQHISAFKVFAAWFLLRCLCSDSTTIFAGNSAPTCVREQAGACARHLIGVPAKSCVSRTGKNNLKEHKVGVGLPRRTVLLLLRCNVAVRSE